MRVQLGPIDKKLYVIGNRYWHRGSASDPEPFTRMAVSWENAFGGEGYDKNPLGRGYKPIEDERTLRDSKRVAELLRLFARGCLGDATEDE